ncbi:MAG: selenide, water dikinase SelD [Gemmatimonadaceae bacterium]
MAASPVKLTRFASSAGCAAKMGAADLSSVLGPIPASDDPRLLVGRATFDDAAAFQISDDMALIQTVDFFPPMVDDPYLFGQIAAANALSDVYAMGGQPLTALNIVAFPSDELGPEVLTQILLGGEDKVREADAIVVGGHTVLDREVKYGMAVTGKAHPRFLLTNAGARVGDKLVLTKPIGTGIITTAVKRGLLTEERAQRVFTSMTALNGAASRAALAVGATCATDVTGFSLLGHASHIARASGVTIRINMRDVPVFDWVTEAIAEGVTTAGGGRNASYLEGLVDWGNANAVDRAVLTDPQTSGGLLVAVAPNKLDRFLMRVAGAVPIGDVIQPADTPLIVA